MDGFAKLLQVVNQLLETLIQAFGPVGTVLVGLAIYLIFFITRIYQDRRKDKEINQALAAKEQALHRAASEARMWRVLYFKEARGWSDDQINRLIMQVELDDPIAVREVLENAKRGEKGAK